MTRPTRVKVGFTTVNVRWFNDDEWFLQRRPEDAQGETSLGRSEIAIRTGPKQEPLDEPLLREVLFHELMHAILGLQYTFEYNKHVPEEEREEYMIRTWSPGLFGLLTDPANSKVRDYVLGL